MKGGSMQPLPHYYDVTVSASAEGSVEITSNGLNPLVSAPPVEFDGPGDLWSPETLFVAALADCLVLTFRAIANLAKLRWTKFVCESKGTVDRSDGVTRFIGIQLDARLVLPADGDAVKARRLLEKAEKACLVSNSLKFPPTLEVDITFEEPALAPTA
jgi:peroxiredoxin-like protein